MSRETAVHLEFLRPLPDHEDCIGVLSLNRPEQANAFNGAMIAEISQHLEELEGHPHCRVVLVQGKGKHFSGGADLAWMKDSAKLSYFENLAEARRMGDMFARLHRLPIPTIAVVRGATFGGAVGLTACCDFAIAADSAKFCLSEVKLGLLPAVILPYLKTKIRIGELKRLSLTAELFKGKEAQRNGLIDLCCSEEDLNKAVTGILRAIFANGREAMHALKGLFLSLDETNSVAVQKAMCAEAIAKARSSQEGQQGLQAFLAKTSPSWSLKIPETWSVEL